MTFLWGDVEAATADNGEWRKTAEEFTKPPKWIPFPSHNLAYRPHEAENFVWITRDNASGISDLKRFVAVVKGCSFFAIRGCFEFDSIWITLNSELYKKPFIPVGLLPPSGIREEDDARDGEWKILEWLSKRSPRSVVYVAFGSEDTLSPEQKREPALGLELSKIPFLWALRRPAGHPAAELLPEAFEERTRYYGLVATSWVPQLKVGLEPRIDRGFLHALRLEFNHRRPPIWVPLHHHAIVRGSRDSSSACGGGEDRSGGALERGGGILHRRSGRHGHKKGDGRRRGEGDEKQRPKATGGLRRQSSMNPTSITSSINSKVTRNE